MSQNRNYNDFSLSYDQRLLLQLYIDFYNHTTNQMDSLHELQNEIRVNINQIVGLSTINQSRNTRQNSNFTRNSFRQSNHNHSQNHSNINSTRNEQEQRRRRSHLDSTNDRYSFHGSIPYSVPFYSNNGWSDYSRAFPRENQRDSTFLTNFLRTFYESIQVAPTRQEIDNATRIVNFAEIENPINNSCPVTLDRFENTSNVTQIIPCGHIFSSIGIDNWLQSNVRCPVCRYDIRNYNATTPTSENINEESSEETKDEVPLEESKNDSNEPIQERNSIPNRRNINTNRRIFTSSEIQNTLSSLGENILGQILNPSSNSGSMRNFVFDPSFNSLTYDASNNQFIFDGFLLR